MSDELKCGPCRRGQHGCCDGGLYVQCECCGMATGQATGDDLAEKVAAVLGEHRYREVLGDYEVAPFYKHFGCTCGWEQNIAGMSGWRSWMAAHDAHLAAALLPLIREREAAAWDRALREAAEEIGEGDGISRYIGMDDLPAAVRAEKRAQQWLCDRAVANPYAGSEGGDDRA